MTTETEAQPLAAPAPRNRRRLYLIAAGATAAVVAAGAIGWSVMPASRFDLRGDVLGEGGMDPKCSRSDITITDASGATIGLGQLDVPKLVSGDPDLHWYMRCQSTFSVNVPAGKGFYGIEVDHKGRVQYPEAAVKGKLVHLSVGK